MWYFIKDLLLISMGAGIGIMTLALVQAGSKADKQLEKMEKERSMKK